MYHDISDTKYDIMQLQKMLRAISAESGYLCAHIPEDGVMGPCTVRAVKIFQKEKGLPETGKVDLTTWEAVCSDYCDCTENFGNCQSISPFPHKKGYAVCEGERSDLVIIIQIMLNELRLCNDSYGYIPPNGRFGTSSVEAVRGFQSLHGIKVTGCVDAATWNAMAKEYNSLI